jgi:hypothetical protein
MSIADQPEALAQLRARVGDPVGMHVNLTGLTD